MELKIGVISDCHKLPLKYAELLVWHLGSKQPDLIVLNGDIFGDQTPQKEHGDYFYMFLRYTTDTNIPCIVVPGSHEIPVLVRQIAGNFKFERKPLYVAFYDGFLLDLGQDLGQYQLLCLPGSEVVPPYLMYNAFVIDNSKETGEYEHQHGVAMITNLEEIVNAAETQIRDPEKVIVLSHNPPKTNYEKGVDRAKFGVAEKDFYKGKQFFPRETSIFTRDVAENLLKEGHPISLKEENVGSQDLSNLLSRTGIKICISSHIHEAVHHAHNSNGIPFEEGKEYPIRKGFFFNPSYGDRHLAGIIYIKDGKIGYERIKAIG